MELKQTNNNKGFGMLEAIIGLAAAVIFVLAFSVLIQQAIAANRTSTAKMHAELYLRELAEISKDLEQGGWDQLEKEECRAPFTCHPQIVNGKWHLVSGEEEVQDGIYVRSIQIEDVYRNDPDLPSEITSNGGVSDENTKKITALVAWNNDNYPYAARLETYVYKK